MAPDSDAAAAAAALRGASIAFSHQKQQQQQQQQQHQQQLSIPVQHRAPSASPSRPPHSSSYNSSSSIPSLSLNRQDTGRSTVSNSALLAATSAATSAASHTGSTRQIPTAHTPQQQLLRPISPVRSPSPQRVATAAARTSHSRSPSRPGGAVALGGGGSGAPVSALSASFLAATRAANRTASQAASPGLTPSHTGHGTLGSNGGPPPAHLSAALSASAAGDERRRAAAAAVAANSATASRSTDSLGRLSAAYTGNSYSASSLALTSTTDPDTSAIPPTSSLISMFEESINKPAPKPRPKKPKNPQMAKSAAAKADDPAANTTALKAFTPPRSVSPAKEDSGATDDQERTPKAKTTKQAPKPVSKVKPKPPPSPKAEQKPAPTPKPTATTAPAPEPETKQQPAKPAPAPKPKPKPPTDNITKTEQPLKAEKSRPAVKPPKLERSTTGNTLRQHRLPLRGLNDEADVMDRPSPTPIQVPTPPRPRVRDPSVASGVSAVSAASRAHSTATSSSSVGRAASTASHRHRRASVSGVPTPPPPRRSATAVDGLASAIMAGSLAAAAAAKMSPQPTSSSAVSRPASPTKRTTTMLHTLRRDRSPHSDGDEIYESHYKRSHYHRDGRLRQGKLHFSHATGTAARHKHNHHHEGSRKRWREAITERQRRRYEAVWASNRGQRGLETKTDYSLDDEMVPNVVVRDIWRRSRLPADELAEVWDLVDDTASGGLSKMGFVVGLWLIDQRLRGRKIPARVSESVWASARGMQPKRR